MSRSTKYWEQMADKSLPVVDRMVAHAYVELEDATEIVRRAMQRLAAQTAEDAQRWLALEEDIETCPVPMTHKSPISEQADRAIRRFREKEAALKAVLAAKRQFDRESE